MKKHTYIATISLVFDDNNKERASSRATEFATNASEWFANAYGDRDAQGNLEAIAEVQVYDD